jgi:acyl-CoA thioesterase FadM
MESITVELTVATLKAASLVWRYRILKTTNEVIMEGEVKMASVGKELKPVRFPEPVRALLEGIVI